MEEKRCSKCGEVKALGEFQKKKDRKSGISSACKVCLSSVQKRTRKTEEHRAKEREKRRKYKATENGRIVIQKANAKYRTSERGREYRKLWARLHSATELGKEQRKNRRAKELTRHLARDRVGALVFSGKLPPAKDVPCSAGPEDCFGRHEYHHDSYREEDWLKVRCLCTHHHRQWHQENMAIPYEEQP